MTRLTGWFKVEANRAYLYRVSFSAGVVAGSLGVVTQDKALALVGLTAAILNIMPAKNTSTKRLEE